MKTIELGASLVVATIAVPYLLGYWLSPSLIAEDHFRSHRSLKEEMPPSRAPNVVVDEVETEDTDELDCGSQLENLITQGSIFDEVEVAMHHNGMTGVCGKFTISVDAIMNALKARGICPNDLDKYTFETLLTDVAIRTFEENTCGPEDTRYVDHESFMGYCDPGPDITPILFDHDRLIRLPDSQTLPCRFYTREGLRLSKLTQLMKIMRKAKQSPTCEDNEQDSDEQTCALPQLAIYAVPAGRVFMLAPKFVGEIFDLAHVKGANNEHVSVEVLSLSPRVFDVHNFFSRAESADLVRRALAEKSESHRIKRSSTGAEGYNINTRRTSESGFDTHGRTAMAMKKRCFNMLGFDEYNDGHSDGLQILRYNLTTAYVPHMDYIDDPGRRLKHDYDSAAKGGNRFATVLLYMSDLKEGDGGETVFTKAWPVGQVEEDHVQLQDALQDLRSSGDASLLKKGSWEEKMVAECRSRLAVRPHAGRAVLFYSQHPNGEEDKSSLHGGCPVLQGEKWAANLWVWNTIRDGFDGNPINPRWKPKAGEAKESGGAWEKKQAVFRNSGKDPQLEKAVLYFNEDTFWSKLGSGDTSSVNTFEGHEWTLKVDDKIMRKWKIGKEKSYTFNV